MDNLVALPSGILKINYAFKGIWEKNQVWLRSRIPQYGNPLNGSAA